MQSGERYLSSARRFFACAALLALIAANPDRILWGSNWPHPGAHMPGYVITDLMPWRDIDDTVVLNLLPAWESDAAVRKTILVDNPARLFGF